MLGVIVYLYILDLVVAEELYQLRHLTLRSSLVRAITDAHASRYRPCMQLPVDHKNWIDETRIGTDMTEGRYADVSRQRCRHCGHFWLRYQVEYEGFSRSGRWAMCPIDDASAFNLTPEQAPAALEQAAWHVYGGSYWGHAGKIGTGKLNWSP